MKKYGTVCYLKEKQSQKFSQLAPHELFTIEGVRVRHVAWLVKPHLLIFIAKLAAFSNKHLFSFLFWNFFFTVPWIFPILDFGTAGAVRVNCAVWQAYARAYSPVGRVSHDLSWRAHCLENYVFCLVQDGQGWPLNAGVSEGNHQVHRKPKHPRRSTAAATPHWERQPFWNLAEETLDL